MGYEGLKSGIENCNHLDERSVKEIGKGRIKAESLQKAKKAGGLSRMKKAWKEEEHLHTLREVQDMLARGPPAIVAAASEEEEGREVEWQEREDRLRQRETLQKFSKWIYTEKASKTLGSGKANYQDFGSFGGSSFRGSNGSEMCKIIYDRERQRFKATNGPVGANLTLGQRNCKSRPTTVPRS